MSGRWRAALLALATILIALPAGAQVPHPRERGLGKRPQQRPTTDTTRAGRAGRAGRAPGDTTGRDSTQRELVQWLAEDSVMRALEERPGYTATRYQGREVVFDARTHALTLVGAPSAVARGEAVLVGDTLYYDDSLQVVRARGDTIVLRDPSQGSSDVVARGQMIYNLAERRAVVSNVATAVESGERWFVAAKRGGFVSDTATQTNAFYGRDGSITSCDLPNPDYHFTARQIKVVSGRVLVARPATLYIADVPVMWLPFLFADLRKGRRSGIIPPRIGVSDIVRTSPSYRRHVEDLGYYWVINDYMDAQLSFDWRSGVRGGLTDPGWTKYHGEFRYRWLDRFVSGDLATSFQTLKGSSRNFDVYWNHNQDFSQQSHLGINLNYSSNTIVQSRTTTNPYAALATIRSSANYTNVFGPVSLNLGGNRTQYPGRTQVDQNFPTLSLATRGPLAVGSWLVWTPTFQLTTTDSRNIDQGQGVFFRYLTGAGGRVDSTRVNGSQRATTMSLATPFKIFDFNLSNNFSFSDRQENFPGSRTVYASAQDTVGSERRYARTYSSGLDWTTSFALPALFQGTWNLTPSVNFSNVDPQPFWIRNERTGGQWVHQSKRPNFGVSVSPTFFGLFPGFGAVQRLRHSITTQMSYSYAPAARVSDEFLLASGVRRQGYLANLRQNAVSLGIQTNLEAKLRNRADTGDAESGTKIKVLSLSFDQLGYDFERYRAVRLRAENPASISRWAGFNTSNFGYNLRSDLLPGFSLRTRYSLFEGDITSDTARFKPYREDVSASFSVGRSSSLITLLSRVFGHPTGAAATPPGQPTTTPGTPDDAESRQLANLPVAGTEARMSQFSMPNTSGGWQASFTFSSTRQRPPRGGNVVTIDPKEYCANLIGSPSYDYCRLQVTNNATGDSLFSDTRGSRTFTRQLPRTTLQSSLAFNVTPKWSAHWSTTYDFVENQFASHIVSLQRDLHDWRAVFAFTQAPNGNFAFNFFIALKAQPDLKFDYDRRSYRARSIYSP